MPIITFKVTADEARRIRARARAVKAKSVSEFLRTVSLDEVPGTRGKRVLKKHPVSGLLIDATPGPAVSQSEIDAALADFP